ncbi:thiamine ABC transporter substrate binding subunit [Nocardioides sp.]|uniref:thiamine ABC transporter substrate-binding protein n=1 Tax=Nocardioides sp. TaxID=35761 RepID=UPI002733C712|nr:thiamine ABC transporter substrate-binding protein [Nocardioides sp.]MDP3895007.1 thiamine ABC transporter substrate-binding protein [Nocardioides sp.]
MLYSRALLTTIALATATTLASCSVLGNGDDRASDEVAEDQVVLVTHDSFYLPDELVADFEAESGLRVVQKSSGDAGALTSRLVLTKGSPTGDVAFGVDNTFASRATDEGVFEEYAAELPPGADEFVLDGIGDQLTPIDTGSVCVNVDDTWFADNDVAPPTTLQDLTDPAYRDLLVVPGATTSSPGMAFLLTTIAEFGDDWPAYWEDLMANGAKITSGWSDAYQVDFTQGGGDGQRPIVLSYDTSPAFTVSDDGSESTTSALLDTCYRQVEYAGVLAGADNPEGARLLIDFLLSEEVQAALPDSMYVFPVSSEVELPEAWARFAVQPEDPYQVDPAEITERRKEWLQEWTNVTTQ